MAMRVEVEYFLSSMRFGLAFFDRIFNILVRPDETWQETFLHKAERREKCERNRFCSVKR